MRLHLDPDRVEPLVWEETIALRPELIDGNLLMALGPIQCEGRLEVTQRGFRLLVAVAYEQELACTRCLRSYPAPAANRLELTLMRAEEVTEPEAETELGEADLDTLIVEGEHLETESLIADHVTLEIPMKPLCGADCLGLCSHCGADRNLQPDCCEQPTADPRWAALSTVRDRLAAEGR